MPVTSFYGEGEQLRLTARGRSVAELEDDFRSLAARYPVHRVDEYQVQLLARVFSEPHWARRHPIGSVRFAWRHRHAHYGRVDGRSQQRGFVRCLRSIWRPRFAG